MSNFSSIQPIGESDTSVPVQVTIEVAAISEIDPPIPAARLSETDPPRQLAQNAQAILDEVGEVLDSISEQSPQQQWLRSILPILKQGGKPVAIILALGVVSIPLLMVGGSFWIAAILASGASIVAIRSCA